MSQPSEGSNTCNPCTCDVGPELATDSEVDWDAYDKDVEHGMARQLLRAKHDVLREDAFDQLEQAFIFHTRLAWDTLKWQVKNLLLLRCALCLHRHWRKPYEVRTPGGEGGFCGYGLRWGFRYCLSLAWWAGRHGED